MASYEISHICVIIIHEEIIITEEANMSIIIIWLGIHYDIGTDCGGIKFLYHSVYSLAAHLPDR